MVVAVFTIERRTTARVQSLPPSHDRDPVLREVRKVCSILVGLHLSAAQRVSQAEAHDESVDSSSRAVDRERGIFGCRSWGDRYARLPFAPIDGRHGTPSRPGFSRRKLRFAAFHGRPRRL